MRGRRPTFAGLHIGTHNLEIIPRLGHNRREPQEDVPPPGLKSPRENRKRNSSVLAGLKSCCHGLKRLRKNSCLVCFTGNEGWVPHGPDFLWRLAALIHPMRLSLMKGAHADLSSTAWQEIGVKPGFGLSGIPQHSTRPSWSFRAQPRNPQYPFSPCNCEGYSL
jgi:hypothetical protein